MSEDQQIGRGDATFAEVTGPPQRATLASWGQAKLCLAPRRSFWMSLCILLPNDECKKTTKASLAWEGYEDQMSKLINLKGLDHHTRPATKMGRSYQQRWGESEMLNGGGEEKYLLWSRDQLQQQGLYFVPLTFPFQVTPREKMLIGILEGLIPECIWGSGYGMETVLCQQDSFFKERIFTQAEHSLT